MSDTLTIIERHAADFARGDLPALMADYAEDAVLITKATGILQGKAAISEMFAMVFSQLFQPAVTKYVFEPILTTGEVGLLQWSAETPQVKATGGFDSFVIRGGKIVAQTGGVDIQPA